MRSAAELVRATTKLASLPSIYLRLTEVTNEPRSTAAEVARVISEDTALAARLLKLVNSSFYGFSHRIDTVTQAVSLVGTQQVLDLALASSVTRAFAGIPRERLDMDGFWRHSVACAIAARHVALRCRWPSPERAFVAGLLHDIGRLVLFLQEPQAMATALERAARDGRLLHVAEREICGFDHADVGRELLSAWKLPPVLQEAVGRHHRPERAGSHLKEAAAVHLGDLVANAMALGSSGEQLVPPLDAPAWAALGVEPEFLAELVAEVDRQHADVVQVMLVYDYWSAGEAAAQAV